MTRNIRSSGLILSLALCAALPWAVTGCQSAESTAPASPVGQYLVVEGKARVDPSNYSEKVSSASLFNGPIEATADSAFDPSIQDANERLLMAEAAARREGVRALSRRILALPDADKKPLSQSLETTAGISSAFDRLLREQAKVQFKTTAQEAQAVAQIDGKSVLDLFRKQGISFQTKLSELTPDEQLAVKNETYTKALEDLRTRLREQIMAMKDSDDQPLSAQFEAHPDRRAALEQTLLILQADTTKYDDDGTCHVQSYFDPDKARSLASGGSSSWMFWKR